MKKILIASWNIAGGRTVKSSEFFDYGDENPAYFSVEIKKISANVICLQENHLNEEYTVAGKIAKEIGLGNIFEVPMSPSHIDDKFKLGMAILSDKLPRERKLIKFPYPDFDLFFPDGRKAVKHNKGLQLIKYESVYIANTQLQPLGFFGYSYKNNEGLALAGRIEKLLLSKLKLPLIICGDFSENYGNYDLNKVFIKIFKELKLKNALPDKTTRPLKSGEKTVADFILYSEDFRLLSSEVVRTRTDHYLCWAEFAYA